MILAAPTGKKCPYCSHITYDTYPISGNTINGQVWSDGKRYYPMWKKVSPIVKCNKCMKYYFSADAKIIPSKYRTWWDWAFGEHVFDNIDNIFKDDQA